MGDGHNTILLICLLTKYCNPELTSVSTQSTIQIDVSGSIFGFRRGAHVSRRARLKHAHTHIHTYVHVGAAGPHSGLGCTKQSPGEKNPKRRGRAVRGDHKCVRTSILHVFLRRQRHVYTYVYVGSTINSVVHRTNRRAVDCCGLGC